MIGAIAGDIVGSVYEWNNIKIKECELFSKECFFTDDSVLTVALADSILNETPYSENLKIYYHRYLGKGFGGSFDHWAKRRQSEPYNSWGNGAAMRVSPVGYAYDDLSTVLSQAEAYTAVTRDHPEGIKGVQATAAAIFLARSGATKSEIRDFIEKRFDYDLSRHVDEIRLDYRFDESCQGTVPQAIRAFIDSTDFEDAIGTAVSLGGDSDTLAGITGGIAQAFFSGVPETVEQTVYTILEEPLREITEQFMIHCCRG